jgi:exocyst complex component 8
MTNVFKIRSGKETHVYRTETQADKKNLLSQFRNIAEEFAQRRQREREGEHERRKSVWQGGGAMDVRTLRSLKQRPKATLTYCLGS